MLAKLSPFFSINKLNRACLSRAFTETFTYPDKKEMLLNLVGGGIMPLNRGLSKGLTAYLRSFLKKIKIIIAPNNGNKRGIVSNVIDREITKRWSKTQIRTTKEIVASI